MPQGVLPFQIEGEQSKSRMTSYAGLLPFIELMARAGLLRAADAHVGVRAGGSQGFTDGQLVLALCLLNLVGGEGVADLDVLESDEGLGEMVRAAELSGADRSRAAGVQAAVRRGRARGPSPRRRRPSGT
jgi:hypothetical protein